MECRCCAEEALSHEYFQGLADDAAAEAAQAAGKESTATPTDVDMATPFESASTPKPAAALPVPVPVNGRASHEVLPGGRSKSTLPGLQRQRLSSCESGLRLAATAGALAGGGRAVWPAAAASADSPLPNGIPAAGKRHRSASFDVATGEAMDASGPGARSIMHSTRNITRPLADLCSR